MRIVVAMEIERQLFILPLTNDGTCFSYQKVFNKLKLAHSVPLDGFDWCREIIFQFIGTSRHCSIKSALLITIKNFSCTALFIAVSLLQREREMKKTHREGKQGNEKSSQTYQ
jgi:hypothetical protein